VGAALAAAVAAWRLERMVQLERLGRRERPEQPALAEHAAERPQVACRCSSKKNGPTPMAKNML
jgi:hypothetical protein